MRLEFVVAACIIRDDHRVLLIWHKRHKEWLPPGGHLKDNETPDDAVVREVHEETGLEIDHIDYRKSTTIEGIKRQLPLPFFADVHNVGDHDHCCFYYLARPKNQERPVTLNLNEVEDYRWFDESDLSSVGVPPDVKMISRLALVRSTLISKPVPLLDGV